MEEPIIGKTRVEALKSAVSTEVSAESVILNMEDGLYYGLDPVGARIWQLIQQPITFDEIIEILLSEYAVERDVCRMDVISLLMQMADRKLIHMTNNPS